MSIIHQIPRTGRSTDITVNMKANARAVCATCRIPLVMSCAGMNGGALRIEAVGGRGHCFPREDLRAMRVVWRLSDRAICALRERELPLWLGLAAGRRGSPFSPVHLHNRSARSNPSFYKRKKKQPNACPDHCSGALWNPSEKPQIISRREMKVRKHVASTE